MREKEQPEQQMQQRSLRELGYKEDGQSISKHPTVTDRRKVREAPRPHFRRVAKMWEAIIGSPISPEQVVMCMVALKLAREAGMHDQDNITDAEGYLSLLSEVMIPDTAEEAAVSERRLREIYRNDHL